MPTPGSTASRGTGTPCCCPDTQAREQPRLRALCGRVWQRRALPRRGHSDTGVGGGGCHTWVYSSAGGSDVEVTVSYSEALMLYLIYCEGRVKIYFSIRNFPSVSGGWCTVLLLQVLSLSSFVWRPYSMFFILFLRVQVGSYVVMLLVCYCCVSLKRKFL